MARPMRSSARASGRFSNRTSTRSRLNTLLLFSPKAGGGIEKMYREISGRYKGGSALPDDAIR